MLSRESQGLIRVLLGFSVLAMAVGGLIAVSRATEDDEPRPSSAEPATTETSRLAATVANQRSAASTTAGIGPATTSSAPEPRPTTLDGYEALWAEERQRIIDRLDSGPYGLDAKGVLHGPGRFTLDTNQCPADWSDRPGVEADTMTILQLAPLSALTVVGDLGLGAKAYLDEVNAKGGIGPDGIMVELIVKDDGYVASSTVSIVEDHLDNGNEPLAISTIGTPNLEAVTRLLNKACVPALMSLSNSPASGDPINNPWTTGLRMTPPTEARLWVEWIERHVDAPVTVAALVMDSSFGRAYERGFVEAAADSDLIGRFEAVHHDQASPSVAAEMAEIAAIEADVFLSMTAGNPCLLAIQEAAKVDLAASAKIRFTPSNCQQVEAYMKPANLDGEGWLVMGGGLLDPTDGSLADHPWIAHVNDQLTAAGIDTRHGIQSLGYGLRGWAIHQVLEIAANLDGGLTRTNLILAQRSLTEMTHPMLHEGVHFGMEGVDDAFFIEGSELARYDATTQRWIIEEVIDLNGRTPTCSWQPATGCLGAD
ncbi:MAG: ABC transporter substrate-binding protein [Actinomycetia bacterium]|nr:ABC transporter substrate-binding protein [Actinomycetes bacterium]